MQIVADLVLLSILLFLYSCAKQADATIIIHFLTLIKQSCGKSGTKQAGYASCFALNQVGL